MKKKILLFLVFMVISSFIGILAAELRLRLLALNGKKVTIINNVDKPEPKPDTGEKKEIEKDEKPEVLEQKQEEVSEVIPKTPVVSQPKFSFAIIGDTQYFKPGTLGGYQTAVSSIRKINPNLIFALGDLVSSCDKKQKCEEKLNDWKSVLGGLSSKTYPIQGNHDRIGKTKADSAWQEVFSLPTNGPSGFSELTYSFNYENSHFIFLDSEKPEEHNVNKIQRDWLERDLASNKKENTFIFFHEPAYPVSSKIRESLDVKEKERDALWDIFSRHKVTAVFSSHEHIHSRRKINNIFQFVFGNTDSFDHELPARGMAEYSYKGKSLGFVEIEGKQITVNLYSVNGKLINSFKFPS